MNESLKKTTWKSAEKKYVLTSENVEVIVHRFIVDPVAFLSEIRVEFGVYTNADLNDPMQNPAGTASLVMSELCEYMAETELETQNQALRTYVEHGAYTEEGDRAWIELFKAAGYTYDEVYAWLAYVGPGTDSIDRFMIQKSLAVVDRVYGKK